MQVPTAAERARTPWPRAAAVLALSLVVAAAAAGEVAVVGHDVPPVLESATRRTVQLELRNAGPDTWESAAGYHVAYHWRDAAGEVLVWDGERSELRAPVPPDSAVVVEAVLEVPRVDGELLLQWDVVHEGVRWLAPSPEEPRPIPVTVRAGWAFSLARSSTPGWLIAGRESRRRLVIRNDGTRAWPADGATALSYHWIDADGEPVVWDGLRTPLDEAVEPGGEVVLEALLQAPAEPGRYALQWDMVREGVAWFAERDPSPEPPRRVVVTGPLSASPAAWAIASLLLAAGAALVVRRGGPAPALGALAVADVAWCMGALLVKQQAVLFRVGQPAGLRAAALTLAAASLVLLPALLLPRRLRPWCCWALAAVGTAILYADLLYARFFGDLLSVGILGAASQVPEVRASLATLLEAGDAWFWIDLAAGAVLAVTIARLPVRQGRGAERAAAVALAVTVAAGAAAALAAAASGAVNLGQVFRNAALAREVGVLNFHALDLGKRLATSLSRPELDPDEVEGLADWFAERAELRAGTGPRFGAAEGANLLMVQAESLQSFVLDLEVAGQEVTPFLNRWSRGAILFRNTTDQTAQGRSADAELLTQASLLPPAAGAAAFLHADNHFVGLASVLAERGYSTVSAVAYDGAFWNRRLVHPALGFEESLFEGAFAAGEVLGWGLNDRDFFRQMVDRLAVRPAPFCALLLTLSLHHPFEGFPAHLKELELGELEGTPMGSYLHTMRFFDRAFAELVAGLERTGLAGRTVVALWGDHDAGLEWTRELATMAGHRHDAAGWYLSQAVPLLVRLPGGDPSGTSDVPAGHQDVAPTLLALLGVDPAGLPFIGRNLLGEPGDGPVVGEYHCWRTSARLFLQGDGTLDGGRCFELPELRQVPAEACAAGFEAARRQIEASGLVLEHDLQREIATRMAASGGAQP